MTFSTGNGGRDRPEHLDSEPRARVGWSRIIQSRGVRRAVPLVLLLAFFAQLTCGARSLSLTVDEPYHIVRGYVYLTSGDFWMIPLLGHPPFVEGWAALPLLVQPDRPDPVSAPHWHDNSVLYVQDLLPRLGSIEQVEVLTRVPIMLLATVLLAAVWRWGAQLGGWWAALWAAVLMVWDPTMIAHSQLDTTDLGVTALVFGFVVLFWNTVARPSWWRLAVTGVVGGLAMGAKHSGIVIVPLAGAFSIWAWSCPRQMKRDNAQPSGWIVPSFERLIGSLWVSVTIVAIAVGTLWAIYGFEIGRQSGFPWVIPFPSHISSLSALFSDRARTSFLRGHLREGGWWWYYPYVFAIKTPLPFLAAMGFCLFHWMRRGWRAWLNDLPVWLFPVILWFVAMRSEMHIGYRHLLPTLPFLYVWVGKTLACAAPLRLRLSRWGLALGVFWYALGAWQAYPYTLAYFNELIGGPAEGYRHVADSNLDWGQSFKALAEAMRREGISRVNLSYWTRVDPALYDVSYTPLPPVPGTEDADFPSYAPPAGIYAISVTALQGIVVADPELYDWFRHMTPMAQPGYGINIYRVEMLPESGGWVAQCITPTAPLPQEEIVRGFGEPVSRVAHFDCDQAWLYPDGGETGGWFVLHDDAARTESDWIQTHLANARLSYGKHRPSLFPPFSIYEHSAHSMPLIEGRATAPGSDGELVAPAHFVGPLSFQGYQIGGSSDQGVELHTWWSVNETITRPFSLMAHVVNDVGHPISVADGMGVSITELRPGDWFVQRHQLDLTLSDGLVDGTLWYQTGAYWLDTLERWPVLLGDEAVGDRLILAEVDSLH
ncbi:MAG: hypothetical protein GX620_07130 [Chloroflexi bacterium]|nr:hypothetical protein [Chloroflexota bacterium]